MSKILSLVYLLTALTSTAQETMCKGNELATIPGIVSRTDSNVILLSVPMSATIEVGQQGELYRPKSVNLKKGKMSWNKYLADVEVIRKDPRGLVALKLKGEVESQDLVLAVFEVIFKVHVSDELELQLFEYNSCTQRTALKNDTLAYGVGCTCEGRKLGEWNYYSSDDRLVFSEVYDKHGYRTGKYKAYYPNGQVRSEGKFADDQRIGSWKNYFPDGREASSTSYQKDGRPVGGQYFYNEAGMLVNETQFMETPLGTGWHKEWYDNGKLKVSCNFKLSGIENYFRVFYESGHPKHSIWLHGSSGLVSDSTFYPDGQLRSAGFFRPSSPDIEWSRRLEVPAHLEALDVQISGDSTGVWSLYCENGLQRGEVGYKSGLRSGSFSFYYPDGSPERSGAYDSGMPTGAWKFFYPSGQLRTSEEYYAGELNGPIERYAENGQIVLRANYEFGKFSGKYATFHENGKPLTRGGYGVGAEAGLETGTWIEYYESGAKKSKGKYESGKKVGTWTTWDASGVKSKRVF